jgi:CRP/FNR family cyclic AMP-dependent transcriptional regulator
MSSAASEKVTKVLAIKGVNLREVMLGNIDIGFNILERLCFLLRNRIQGAYGAMEKI